MVPTLTNVSAGIPSSKVKYSKLSSTDDGHITCCLLLAGYISKVGANRAFPVLTVGVLVFLPRFYHPIIAYRAYRGCQG
eukprot:bmy_06843T0